MTAELPATLYTAAQSRALDKTCIETTDISGFRLMKRAGRAVFAHLQRRWPAAKRLTILCGGGNNGGDGLVVAGLAQAQGLSVQLRVVGPENYAEQLQGEARQAWQWAIEQGVTVAPYQDQEPLHGEVIVDALLGTGLNGPVRADFAALIRRINRLNRAVISVDIPSGLCADTGQILGVAVRAAVTVTFIGLKQGLFMHQAVTCVGELCFDSLRVPDSVYEQVPMSAFRTTADDVRECLPRREADAHKGRFGHVVVIGGGQGMGGAAIMAAEAALASGAGKVSLATHPEHVCAALSRCPEVMTHGITSAAAVQPLLAQATALVVGPGLGQGAFAEQVVHLLSDCQLPVVVDADGLNVLASKGWLGKCDRQWVLTPHPGEAARLLGEHVAEVQRNRIQALARLQQRCGATVVLKGPGTLVSDGDALHLCSAGNAGMAVAGMGDVLSGVIGSLLAQGMSPLDAARVGVYAHAAGADRYSAEQGLLGMRASRLSGYVRQQLNWAINAVKPTDNN